MNKKAAAHLEMIIAFMLFASFAFFLLFFIKIPKAEVSSDSVLESIQYSLEDYARTNLTKITLKTESSDSFFIDLSSFNLPSNSKSLVKTPDSSLVPSYFDGPSKKLYIQSTQNFFFVYLSDGLSESSTLSGFGELFLNKYTIGGIEKINLISQSNLLELATSYNTDYLALKQKLKVLSNYEFSLKSDIPGFVIKKEVPTNVNIEAKTNLYKILNPSGEIINKDITIELWQ